MTEGENRLSRLTGIQHKDVRLDRNLLKDLAAETLRDHISSGRIPEGTKLTEREVSRLLGISRMPARDALMILEAEGLVVSRPDGRYVIELTEKDVRDIHVLRWTLEGLAVARAAANASEEGQAILEARLGDLEDAAAGGDRGLSTRCDMALHRAIWRQADNPHLLRVLDAVLGAIFVLCDRVKVYGELDFAGMVDEHRQLVALIAAGEEAAAALAMEQHLRNALAASLQTFHLSDRAETAGSMPSIG
jgi:DNA-binding GntR family transcriptional regulator